MGKPLFVVPLADLESGEKHRSWEIPTTWLSATLSDTEATPRGAPGKLDVALSLNGREVVVRGRVTAALQMPCARTLDPVHVDIDSEVFLMLSPAAVPETPSARKRQRGARGGRKRQKPEKAEETVLTSEDAARDTYVGDEVVLDAFAREFIVLELPMFPLREDLRSAETPGIPAPPNVEDPAESQEAALDPRLAPLARIARRLRDKE